MNARRFGVALCAVVVVIMVTGVARAAINEIDQYGYYYQVTGGLFPTGTTPNGDNASGGTFRFLSGDPFWGLPTGTWQKDDWYPSNASIALTLKNGSTTVYDNNGLNNGSFPANYYTYNAATFPTQGAGDVVAYSMSNNYNFIYTGYFKLDVATTVTQLSGYFLSSHNDPTDVTGGFDPTNPALAYHMNIFSNVSGDLLPDQHRLVRRRHLLLRHHAGFLLHIRHGL